MSPEQLPLGGQHATGAPTWAGKRKKDCQAAANSGPSCVHPKVPFCIWCVPPWAQVVSWCFSRTWKISQNQRAVRCGTSLTRPPRQWLVRTPSGRLLCLPKEMDKYLVFSWFVTGRYRELPELFQTRNEIKKKILTPGGNGKISEFTQYDDVNGNNRDGGLRQPGGLWQDIGIFPRDKGKTKFWFPSSHCEGQLKT